MRRLSLGLLGLAVVSCYSRSPRDDAPASEQAPVVEFFPAVSTDPAAPVPSSPTDGPGRRAPVRAEDLPNDRELTPPPSAAPRRTSWLVWLRDGDGGATTFYLDSAGLVLRSEPGATVGLRGHLARIALEPESVPTEPCAPLDGDRSAPETAPVPDRLEPGHATRAVFTEETGLRTVMVRMDDGEKGAAEVQHTIDVLATVGPYVFLRQTLYTYTCGAHGNTSVELTLWNAESMSTMPMPTDVGPIEGPLAQAIELLNENDSEAFQATEESTSVSELLPHYGEDGTLTFDLKFTSSTCYACSFGDVGSYRKGVTVPSRGVPAVFDFYRVAPRAIGVFLSHHVGSTVGGWSAVDELR